MDETLAPFFADFGITATSGGESASVFFDHPARQTLDGMAIAEDYEMLLAHEDLPSLARGAEVTFATADNANLRWDDRHWWTGKNFKVREVMPMDDGALKRVTLRLDLP
jgi:hypothetical protein